MKAVFILLKRRPSDRTSASNLEQLEAEQERLAEVVKEQNISPDEVVRMNTEHEQLAQSIDELKAKIAEVQKDVHSLEVAVANHGAIAEEAVDTYTTLLSGLGLFPPLPQPFQDIDIRMVLNTAASQPEHLLKGQDIRHVIRPTLNDILEAKRDERIAVNNKRIEMDRVFDGLISECEKLEDEINETEKTVMVLDEQAEDLREVKFFPFVIGLISSPTLFLAVIDCATGSSRQQR